MFRWKQLKNNANRKKDDIDASHGVQTFHIECRETISWIEEKTKLLQSTEELGNDLAGIMTLQRRLSGMERDLAAICSQIDNLENEAQKIEDQHPEEAEEIRERITQISAVFEQLNQLIKQRDAKLEEAGDLHRFLRDLDHFQTCSKTHKPLWHPKIRPIILSKRKNFSISINRSKKKSITMHRNSKTSWIMAIN